MDTKTEPLPVETVERVYRAGRATCRAGAAYGQDWSVRVAGGDIGRACGSVDRHRNGLGANSQPLRCPDARGAISGSGIKSGCGGGYA